MSLLAKWRFQRVHHQLSCQSSSYTAVLDLVWKQTQNLTMKIWTLFSHYNLYLYDLRPCFNISIRTDHLLSCISLLEIVLWVIFLFHIAHVRVDSGRRLTAVGSYDSRPSASQHSGLALVVWLFKSIESLLAETTDPCTFPLVKELLCRGEQPGSSTGPQ